MFFSIVTGLFGFNTGLTTWAVNAFHSTTIALSFSSAAIGLVAVGGRTAVNRQWIPDFGGGVRRCKDGLSFHLFQSYRTFASFGWFCWFGGGGWLHHFDVVAGEDGCFFGPLFGVTLPPPILPGDAGVQFTFDERELVVSFRDIVVQGTQRAVGGRHAEWVGSKEQARKRDERG